jgi:hypothetical protein
MPPADNEQMNTEMRVRRALGLDATPGRAPHPQSDPSRSRRRFVQDGEVPVVVVHSDRRPDGAAQAGSRVAELEAALEAERTARAAVSRALDEARGTVQSLQTRLTHAEIAFAEALATEQAARAAAEATAQTAATVVQAARKPKAELMAKASISRKPTKPAKVKQPRGRLVKWWAPDFQATKATS